MLQRLHPTWALVPSVAFIGFIVSIVLFAGCASPGPGVVADDPEVRRALENLEPLEFTVLVAPLRKWKPDPDTIPWSYPIPLTDEDIGALVQESLLEDQIFTRVVKAEERPSWTREGLIEEAQREGAELLLEFELKGLHCRYVGPNALWFPNLLLWLTLWAPSLWVADQTYEVIAEAEYSIRNTQDGQEVFRREFWAKAKIDLDYIDRDVDWWGLIRTEDTGENWSAILERARPNGLFQLQKAFALSVLRDFYPLGRSAGFKRDVYPKQSSASEVAIVIGVAGYRDPALQGLANFGVADASSFLEFLRQREGSALKEEGTRLLLGAGATREEIFGAFRKYDLDGTQHRDRITVYFSGVGGSLEAPDGTYEFYLLPQDADPEDLPGTAISLGQIKKWLGGANANEILLILDCGFGSSGGGKGVRRNVRRKPAEVEAFRDQVRRLIPGEGRGLILAGQPGDYVSELPGDQRSTLTYYLLSYLERRGDTNKDGQITLEELGETVPDKVSHEAHLMGKEQTPLVVGDESFVLNKH